VLKECGSVLRATLGVACRQPGWACIVGAATWLAWPVSVVPWAASMIVLAAGICWARIGPASFSRVAGLVRGAWWSRRCRSLWPESTQACNLARNGVPQIRRIHVRWPHVRVLVRPVLGQTADTFESAAEPLRMALGAARVRVEPDGVRDVVMTFTVGDELRSPLAAAVPAHTPPGSVPIGRTERGESWRLAIGPHTLVAGCSGAGKGSVFWSFALALAPAAHEGRVQLHGIDLKGGMEILMGKELFTTTATDESSAVVSLERLVAMMRARNREYAGRVRSHEATLSTRCTSSWSTSWRH
jgi:S-DNA-T family DNA segregation ATPase FtsK/SpoIIIE